MIYYLPSCKYQAAHPLSSQKIQNWLSDVKSVKIAGCCRTSQHLFQAGDVVLTNCTSCSAITCELSPEVQEMSVYEFLLQTPEFVWPDYHGEQMTVQDCYRSRHDRQLMEAVRECLCRMNVTPVELEENLEKTRFDGMFPFSNVAQANLEIAPDFFTKLQQEYVEVIPREEQLLRMRRQVGQYTTRRTVAYCNACVSGIQLGGGEGVFLLDLITRDLPEEAFAAIDSTGALCENSSNV